MTTNSEAANSGAKAIADNTAARGWEIENKGHGLAMLLCDLIEYADREGLDIDLELERAREVVADCRT